MILIKEGLLSRISRGYLRWWLAGRNLQAPRGAGPGAGDPPDAQRRAGGPGPTCLISSPWWSV